MAAPAEKLAADFDRRLLILAPTRRDAVITQSLLSPLGVESLICTGIDDLVSSFRKGAAAILMTEEMVVASGGEKLHDALAGQAAWSDIPIMVLTRQGADSAAVAEAVRTLGNVTLLERPVRVAALISAVRSAIRARDRQYQIRGHLAERIKAEESLRAADRRKDEFLATLGHELRNPLAPLLTGLHLLKLGTINDPGTARACTVMERQVNHLVRLVDDLLEVSRITRGVIDVRREPLELAAVLRAAVETSRPAIEAGRHELIFSIPADPVPVIGDQVRLTQVFANLLNNASKYTPDGGHIWLTLSTNERMAAVSVRDDGLGIPPSQLETVFDMFTQLDRSRRRTQGGLGIGLTLVKSLVKMHEGTVEARSNGPDTGSEFIVRLPLHQDRARPAVEVLRPEPFPPQRILIVDDNRDAADTLASLLARLGANVSVAHSGREALESLDRLRPEAVLLDLGMPGMDGFEVARQIRALPGHADTLLIALTGWGQDEDRHRSRTAGFDHHFVKPLDVSRLRALLMARFNARGFRVLTAPDGSIRRRAR